MFKDRMRCLEAGFWLLLIGLLAVIYLPGLKNELLFDDARLTDGTIFGVYGSLLELRPRLLSYGSFVWIEAVFGEGWWKQRLFNLFLHGGVIAALAMFYRRLQAHVSHGATEEAPSPASARVALYFGLLLFALSPVAVYAVGYLIQRSILMATLFSVLACWSFLRGLETRQAFWFAGALLSYAAAVLSKEHAVMIAAMAVPLYAFVCRPDWKKLALLTGVGAALIGVAVALLLQRYGGVVGVAFDTASQIYVQQIDALAPGAADRVWWLSILNQSALFFKYGFLWFLPNVLWMSMDLRPAFPLTWSALPGLPALLAYGALLCASAWAVLRRSDALGLIGLCMLFPLLLFATEFATVWIQDPFVLYRSYLWAIAIPGLAWALLAGFRPFALGAVGVVVAVIFAGLAFERNTSLRDEYRAWNDAAEKIDLQADAAAVGRWRPFLNRGSYFLANSMPDRALNDFARAVQLGEGEGSARFNLGVSLQLLQRNKEALASFAAARQQGFDAAGLYYHSGEALVALGRFGEAVDAYGEALKRPQSDENAQWYTRLRRAEAALNARNFDLAVEDLESLRELRPDDARIRNSLGLAYVGKRDGIRARAVFEELLQEHAQRAQLHYGLAMALIVSDEPQEALKAIDEAIRLEPKNPVFRQLRAQLARSEGR